MPGCYPTAVTLVLFLAVQTGLIDPAGIVVVAASGTSGVGKATKPHLLGSETMGSASVYGVGGVYRHIPEIIQNLSMMTDERVGVSFTPMLVPMLRGILATCIAPRAGDVVADGVRRYYEVAYADGPPIDLSPGGIWPVTAGVLGSNRVTVQVAVDGATDRVIVVSATDNPIKDTAGDIIQLMNIALGLDETTGPSTIGVAP